MRELQRKAESAGGCCSGVDSRQLKTSQYGHSSNGFQKKPRSRGGTSLQTTASKCSATYTAPSWLHRLEFVDTDGCGIPQYDPVRLEVAWQALVP